MLAEIRISNFALIEAQSITLSDGLTVLSGETGSGKSIILQALQFLLGERAKPQIVRSGSEIAEVQGLFDLGKISEEIRAALPEFARDEELAIIRTLTSSGKSKVYINGKLGSVSLLEEITSKLVNVCSQNQHVQLLDARGHLDLLDRYAALDADRATLRTAFDAWRQAQQELAEARTRHEHAEHEREELAALVAEISAARVSAGMRRALEGEVKRLANAERLLSSMQRLDGTLSGDGGVLPLLQRVGAEVQELVKLDGGFCDCAELFTSGKEALREFAVTATRYARSIELDEERLAEQRESLAEIARLERRYKTDDAGLVRLLENAQHKLTLLREGSDIEGLSRREEAQRAALDTAAQTLSRRRREAATVLSKEVNRGLTDLNMADAKLAVAVESVDLSASGIDRAELFLSANRGEPPRPLSAIASGGELSRILLVLKQVLRDRTGVNVLVFDEVDSGVSGSVARAVGQKLRALAEHSQVICVTHLPQVASLADHHFLVGKEVKDRAQTVIKEIVGAQRVDEIARMLAGYAITPASRRSAKELLSSKI